jgi:hypothetical protein
LDWRIKGALFTVSSGVAGAASGLSFGWLGSLVNLRLRIVIAFLLALGFLVLGFLDLMEVPVPMPQWNRETPQVWLQYGAARWSIANGLALGSGFFSRIGFLGWYLIPLACLSYGSPLVGALIFGTYGLVRGLSIWPMLIFLRRTEDQKDLAEILLAQKREAKRASTYLVLFISCLALVAVGA